MSESELNELVEKLLDLQVHSKKNSTKLLVPVLISALENFTKESDKSFIATKAVLNITRSHEVIATFYDVNNEKRIQQLAPSYGNSLPNNDIIKFFAMLKSKHNDLLNFIVFNSSRLTITIG